MSATLNSEGTFVRTANPALTQLNAAAEVLGIAVVTAALRVCEHGGVILENRDGFLACKAQVFQNFQEPDEVALGL